MELHPFLEKDTAPNTGLWYVLSITGDCPSMRVGHSCSYVPNEDGYNGKVYFIGGANPSATFAETFVLDLDQFNWDTLDTPGLRARYEHAAFQPESLPNKLFIFGGADQGGNHNDIQMLDLSSDKWKTVTATGNVPSPRTYHNNICIGDQFIVYSGGQSGSDPVGDRQVHCFNASTSTWSILNIKGDTPKPRHGHLVVGAGNKVYVHGGMSGTHFYDDLHVLDVEKEQWRAVKQKKNCPSARAAHGGVIADDCLYIFGGMNRDGALDDLWQLTLDGFKWTRIELSGPPPACRLDFAMCVVRLRVPAQCEDTVDELLDNSIQAREVIGTQLRIGSGGSARSSVSSAGSQRSLPSPGAIVDTTPAELGCGPVPQSLGGPFPDVVPYDGPTRDVDVLLVLGGMDTQGEIFEDALVYVIKQHEVNGESNESNEPAVNGS